jgi:hypothetical protein
MVLSQGRYSRLVYIPMSSLSIPGFVHNNENRDIIVKGRPEAKFKKGIQYQGLLSVFISYWTLGRFDFCFSVKIVALLSFP